MAKAHICLIEDDDATRQTVRELLEEEGYEVTEAPDGLAGWTLLNTSTQRMVVVLDHRLPAMDGCDLLELVAHDERLRDQHAYVFMTASPIAAQDDCESAISDVNATVMAKPFNIDELVEAVHEAESLLRTPSSGSPANMPETTQ
ncbi:MAG TPA: response regulator [Ktedonobacterales bacterium]